MDLKRSGRSPDLRPVLDRVLEASVAALLLADRNAEGLMGLQWQAGADEQEWNFNSHLAGLALMTAALTKS